MTRLFSELEARLLIKQTTDPAIARILNGETNERLTLYAGFDPTADSLHVGHLLVLLMLRRFQLAGHRPIAVVGGATGMIGDPSGKSQERSLQTFEQVKKNEEGITKVISRFLDTHGSNSAIITNNADWFRQISFIQFLRDVGKHFTVNHMVAKESVRARLEDREHGISYTEFSYMLLQAYDFYHLNREHGCRLQIGGSDQWGNIVSGIELIRRMNSETSGQNPEVYGVTLPLVMKSDGTKFGKTERGAIWLDAHKTSPYQFYQFFIQTADADVGTFLRYFTFLPLDQIEALEETVRTAPEKREAQRTLAREMTLLVHGEAELNKAINASQALFGTEIRELDGQTLLEVLNDAPSTQKPRQALAAGLSLIDAVAETGLCGSKGASRKDIAAGGIYVNNERVTDIAATLKESDLIGGKYIVLRKGKKNYHLLAFEQ